MVSATFCFCRCGGYFGQVHNLEWKLRITIIISIDYPLLLANYLNCLYDDFKQQTVFQQTLRSPVIVNLLKISITPICNPIWMSFKIFNASMWIYVLN